MSYNPEPQTCIRITGSVRDWQLQISSALTVRSLWHKVVHSFDYSQCNISFLQMHLIVLLSKPRLVVMVVVAEEEVAVVLSI